jgi:hypothetical protein
MEKTVTVTIANGYTGLVIPSDMVELIDLINSQGDRIIKEDITTVTHLAGQSPATSTLIPANIDWPQYYYRMGGIWILGPMPAVGDTVTIVYYAQLAPLVNPSDTNAITLIATDLVAYGALGYAADFYSDRRADRWEARFQQIKDDLQGQADEDELSGGSVVSPAFFYPTPMDSGVGPGDFYPPQG